MASAFSIREVAELADVPVRSVNKAIEEGIVSTTQTKSGKRKMLPLHAVPYAALVSKLELNLTRENKRKLIRTLRNRVAHGMTTEPVEIAPSVPVAEMVTRMFPRSTVAVRYPPLSVAVRCWCQKNQPTNASNANATMPMRPRARRPACTFVFIGIRLRSSGRPTWRRPFWLTGPPSMAD